MARIEAFKGYGGKAHAAKPDVPPDANVVTPRDGTPVRYPGCDGIGVRVVHPSNPRAPAQAMGLVMFYLPPHVKMEPRGHLPEECYVILRGRGVMTLNGEQREVSAGTFVPAAVVRARHREHRRRDPGGADMHLAAESVAVGANPASRYPACSSTSP